MGCAANVADGETFEGEEALSAHQAKDPVLVLHATMVPVAALGTIVQRLEKEGYAVRTAEAPDLFTHSMEQSAAFVANAVRKVRLEFPTKKVRIVAACNGGVATQHYVKFNPEAREAVSHFVSFESAHGGTLEAPVWKLGTGAMNRVPALGSFGAAVLQLTDQATGLKPSDADIASGLQGWSRKTFAAGPCARKGALRALIPCLVVSSVTQVALPSFATAFLSTVAGRPISGERHADELLRAVLLELHVANTYFVYPSSPRGYDLDPSFSIFKEQLPWSAPIEAMRRQELPTGMNVTSIYSCLDYAMVPYDTSHLKGATNVLVCPWTPPAAPNKAPQEVIAEVGLHWSMYNQPFVLDRIVKGLR